MKKNTKKSTRGRKEILFSEEDKAKKDTKKKVGRQPIELTEDMIDELCSKLASGQSMRTALKDNQVISQASVYGWLLKANNKESPQIYKYLLEQYTLARQVQAQNYIDEIMDIADDGSNDWMRNNDPENEGYKYNGEAVGRSRLRVDTRKWVACKVLPKIYGDKADLMPNSSDNRLPTPNLIDITNKGKK